PPGFENAAPACFLDIEPGTRRTARPRAARAQKRPATIAGGAGFRKCFRGCSNVPDEPEAEWLRAGRGQRLSQTPAAVLPHSYRSTILSLSDNAHRDLSA